MFAPESTAEGPDQPKLFDAWMTLLQAELMLGHMERVGAAWPEAAIYLHSAVTALRSVTLMLQKALAHEPGFKEWYSTVQENLGADEEMQYLLEARNHVLKRGALKLMHSHRFEYSGGLPIEVRAIGPDGPDVWLRGENEVENVPVDWRNLEGFKFQTFFRLAPIDELPDSPEREVKEMLVEKTARFRLLILDAEELFDADDFDEAEASKQREELAEYRSGGYAPEP